MNPQCHQSLIQNFLTTAPILPKTYPFATISYPKFKHFVKLLPPASDNFPKTHSIIFPFLIDKKETPLINSKGAKKSQPKTYTKGAKTAFTKRAKKTKKIKKKTHQPLKLISSKQHHKTYKKRIRVYTHASPRAKRVNKRIFHPMEGEIFIVKNYTISFLPNCLEEVKWSSQLNLSSILSY